MASKCDDFKYNRIVAFKVSKSLRVKLELSNNTFRKVRKWFETILDSFEVESLFQKKTAPGAVFFRGFSKFEKIHFFFEKLKIFQKFICFVYNEFLSEDINFFFPAKAETPYFWMMKSLCIMHQQIVTFKALKYLRKAEKIHFVGRSKNRRI